MAGSKAGRVKLAETTGVSEAKILEWVNRADLFRIHGVGEEISDLLEAAGVDEYVGVTFDPSAEGRARTRAVLKKLES